MVPLTFGLGFFDGGFEAGSDRSLSSYPAGSLGAVMFGGDSASSRPGTVTWSRRACTSCDGTRYRIVVSSDLCPIQC